jgi:hypothetical protein
MKNSIIYSCPACNKSHSFLKSDYNLTNILIPAGKIHRVYVISQCKEIIALEFARKSDLNSGMATNADIVELRNASNPEKIISLLYNQKSGESASLGEIIKKGDNAQGDLDELILALGPISFNFLEKNNKILEKLYEKYCVKKDEFTILL